VLGIRYWYGSFFGKPNDRNIITMAAMEKEQSLRYVIFDVGDRTHGA
jgi:hypothetical protein